MGSLPPYKGFEDLGLGMNPQAYFPAQILALFLYILHFSYWLHANCIGNAKDSNLSLRSFVIHPKNGLHLIL